MIGAVRPPNAGRAKVVWLTVIGPLQMLPTRSCRTIDPMTLVRCRTDLPSSLGSCDTVPAMPSANEVDRPDQTLAALLDDLAGEFADVVRSERPDAVTYEIAGRPFATLTGARAE